MAEAVKETFIKSGTYGSPKIWITLMRQGRRVSVNTLAKFMAELGLTARRVRRRRVLTRAGKWPAAPDFVKRDFTADGPHRSRRVCRRLGVFPPKAPEPPPRECAGRSPVDCAPLNKNAAAP
ncbi:IS3 family transposase [Streptomyces shenzhenensis]|uniref:IS3 family transposase n=1 Tax=Streptomyces shenzhenensis TaxID=943815 RepID=UPI0038D42AD2